MKIHAKGLLKIKYINKSVLLKIVIIVLNSILYKLKEEVYCKKLAKKQNKYIHFNSEKVFNFQIK